VAEVVVRSDGKLRQRIEGKGQVVLADEPRAIGGDDAGPDPYTLLLGALGACTAMTLQMYARRKGWPLQGVEVRLRHDRTYAEDCEQVDEDCRIERITRRLRLLGPLDDEQRARLKEVAARCPVHKTLAAHPEIVDEEDE
jgi:putative redox protein